MPFTRAQATALLNKSEMRLFDDSRANALRGLDRTALASRIERTREARDRARDLLKRQRLAARKRGEARDDVAARTARKEALLVELLERFTVARRQAPAQPAAAKKPPARRSAAGGPPAGSAAKKGAAKAPAKKAAANKAVAGKSSAGTGAAAATGARKRAAGRSSASRGAAGGVTPEQALENTRRLLEEKQAQAREPKPWQSIEPGGGQVSQEGYQSAQAAEKAQDLHAAEARMASTAGSSSTRDRRSQGQRDHRSDTE
ncbi:MAG TPA: hypothetical protein VIG97_02785 [Luteimonas sp.]